MNLKLTPTQLRGSITPPPSKSQAHRLIIAAALAQGKSVISNVAFSQDIEATLQCMQALGAQICVDKDTLTITGTSACATEESSVPQLDCGESGSTLRFLIPIALAVAGGGQFTGRGRLMQRPQTPYFELFDKKGVAYTQEDDVLSVRGTLTAGEYSLPGDVSSQFITGLLYTLPLLEGDSVLHITTQLESLDYVAMTLDALKQFGIAVQQENWTTFRIPGGQTYQPQTLAVESDWSQAGFWYTAQGIGNAVEIDGMNHASIQGDIRILSYCDALRDKGNHELDVSQCPDLVPPLALHAAVRGGTTHITNAARLRIKESDRLATVTEVLNALGAKVIEGEDHLIIEGQSNLPGGVTVSAHNDHRIAMMAAIAATCCKQPIVITGAQCVAKSYPNFWEEYVRLGGILEEVPE